ncbi:MAG: glycosyltransferase family 2 protein [Deltaproteobacteria bacterium]|nr:glycosyltransferase family 2 protein [Deltaproteobacteria bacterium]
MEFVYPCAGAGLSVVLPAYNEEENLEAAVAHCLDRLPRVTELPFEVVVVNDGSRDRTGELLDRLAAAHPQVRRVHHACNQGYGQAVLTGIRNTRYDLIFFTDADLQFDLGEIGLLFPHLQDHDLVVGYRLNRQDPPHRLLFAYGWNKLMRLLFGLRIRDVDCAFKLFRRRVMENLTIISRGAMTSAEIMVRTRAAGVTFAQVGVHHYPRRRGTPTGGQLWVIARAFRELARFFWIWYLAGPRIPVRESGRI